MSSAQWLKANVAPVILLVVAMIAFLPAGAWAQDPVPADPDPVTTSPEEPGDVYPLETTGSCNDGSTSGTGGYTAASDCAAQLANSEASGCTITHDDAPVGEIDTLTYSCGEPPIDVVQETETGTPQGVIAELEGPGGPIAQPTPPQTTTNYYAETFTCTSTASNVLAGLAEQASLSACEQQLAAQANAEGAGWTTMDSVVRVTVRCDDATYQQRIRTWTYAGVPYWSVVDTTGSVNCTYGVELLVGPPPA